MFPTRKRGKKAEVNENDMLSRLQLDLGACMPLSVPTCAHTFLVEHDRAHRSRKDDGHADKVDIFRGVTFDDWLKVFMQVEYGH